MYIEKSIPIGMFANLIQKNIIEVIEYAMGNEKLGVRCCCGTAKEREAAISLLAGKPKIIIDLLSLIVLHRLGLADKVVAAFGKLGMARSTLEELLAFREEKRLHEKDGILRVDSQDGELVGHQISSEQVKKQVEEVGAILEWVKRNCDLLPVQEALGINTKIKNEFDRILGKSFVDSILLAKQPGCLLYSDDASLREMAYALYGFEGIWTQALLMYCQHEGALEKEGYNSATIKLTCSNFKFISIDADILDEAYKMSGYHFDKELKYMISKLTESHVSIDTMIRVSVEFVFKILRRTIRPHQYDVIIFALMDYMAKGRSTLGILRMLLAEVEKQNPFNTKLRQEALGIIKKWKDTKPIIN